MLRSGIFHNVVLVPERFHGSPEKRDALWSPNSLPRYARHKRRRRQVKQLKAATLAGLQPFESLSPKDDEQFLFGGILKAHFGHFLVEYLSRCWPAMAQATANTKTKLTVLFVADWPGFEDLPFFKEILAYCGIKSWRVVSAPTKVASLMVAEVGQLFGEGIKPDYYPILERVKNQHELSDASSPKKIAILRGHLAGKGHILGEAGYSDFLHSHGYQPIKPETLSIIDQLKCLYNADEIIISEGSACHLFDLLPPLKARIAFIARRPNTRLDSDSLAPKCAHLVSHKKSRLFLERAGAIKFAGRARALSYVDYDAITHWLIEEDFLPQGTKAPINLALAKDLIAHLNAKRLPEDAEITAEEAVATLMRLIAKRDSRIEKLYWYPGWVLALSRSIKKLIKRLKGGDHKAIKSANNDLL